MIKLTATRRAHRPAAVVHLYRCCVSGFWLWYWRCRQAWRRGDAWRAVLTALCTTVAEPAGKRLRKVLEGEADAPGLPPCRPDTHGGRRRWFRRLMLVPHPDLFPVPVSRRVAALSRLPTAARTRAAFVSGCAIGIHGGLIGLGGAGFRLPVLITFFRFPALEAALLNKVMNLVVEATALPSGAGTVPLSELAAHWPSPVRCSWRVPHRRPGDRSRRLADGVSPAASF